MKKKDLRFLLGAFLGWRLILFFFLFLAIHYLPLQQRFLGGEMANYLQAPWFWAWANFDGEHYLSIALKGYEEGEQAFFPLYPLLMRAIGGFFGGNLAAVNMAGLLISNTALFLALMGFYRLISLDFGERTAKFATILYLLFPTSFYFGAVYTESLFLALSIWAFYFARKRNYFWAACLGMFAAGTRIIGVLLFPIFLVEAISGKRKQIKVKFLWLLLIPLGILAYMYHLQTQWGNPFAFITTLPGFGEHRSATPIILPQVFFRYFVRILPNLNYSYFPIVFTTYLEFLVALTFVLLSVISFFKLRLSYAIYLATTFVIPTLSGSFSSLPRYVLVSFPAFILLAIWFSRAPKALRFLLILLTITILGIATAFFSRGLWIA